MKKYIRVTLFMLSSIFILKLGHSHFREKSNLIQFTYLNFSPDKKEVQKGLKMILSGRGFRPYGLPYSLIKRNSELNFESNDHQIKKYGRFPSFPNRKDGQINAKDFSLSNSVFDLILCNDRINQENRLLQFYPIDHYNSEPDCLSVESLGTKTTVIAPNCFTCHAGTSAGFVIGGAHSNYIDEKQLSSDLKMVEDYMNDFHIGSSTVINKMLNENEEVIFNDYLDFLLTEFMPTYQWSQSPGDNLGAFASYKGMARLQADGNGSMIFPRTKKNTFDELIYKNNKIQLPSVDAHPWWNLKFKKDIFWTGEHVATNARQAIYAFSVPHTGAGEYNKESVARLSVALQYAQGIDSPRYPFDIDWEKVKMGKKLFHGEIKRKQISCSKCHGNYELKKQNTNEWNVSYPGVYKGAIDVGTDPEYAKISHQITKALQPNLQEVRESIAKKKGIEFAKKYGPALGIAKPKGVVAPPLVGLWASPPYFHNGSVPTLYHVLKPTSRPNVWKRPSFTKTGFDKTKIGFNIEESEPYIITARERKKGLSFPKDHENYLETKNYFFTTDYGKSNTGHNFTMGWSEEDIYAVIEFLKAISGPGIKPAKSGQGIKFETGNL